MQAARRSDAFEIRAADGTSARRVDDALEVRSADDRLLFRYRDGCAELSVPLGDLVLEAPHGRVCIRSGEDVSVEAARDVRWQAGREVAVTADGASSLKLRPHTISVATPRLDVTATATRYESDATTVVARAIITRAERIATHVDRHEVKARHIVETAHSVFRDVEDLLQQRIGRARSMVRDVWTLRSRRSVMVSSEDTSIDGERILLG